MCLVLRDPGLHPASLTLQEIVCASGWPPFSHRPLVFSISHKETVSTCLHELDQWLSWTVLQALLSFLVTHAWTSQAGQVARGDFFQDILKIHTLTWAAAMTRAQQTRATGLGGEGARSAGSHQAPRGQQWPQRWTISSNRSKGHTNQGGAWEPGRQFCGKWHCGTWPVPEVLGWGRGTQIWGLLQAFLNVAVNLEVTLKLLPPPLCS